MWAVILISAPPYSKVNSKPPPSVSIHTKIHLEPESL